MIREFSAGGVLVRRLRGRFVVAAIRPGGKQPGLWALPKGLVGPGEKPEETALREVAEETGVDAASLGKLGDVRYVYTRRGERVFKVVSFYLLRYRRGRLGDLPPELAFEVAETRWLPADEAPRLLAYKGERDMAEQLRSGRKTATIRLGDKSAKYRKGMVVQVLAGARFSAREKVFDAVIDKVEVKQLRDLSPREIEHDNPEIRRVEEMTAFLGQLYTREVSEEDTVTVIRFSQIRH